MNSEKRQKRIIANRKKVKAINTLINRLVWGKKKPRGLEQWQKDLNHMTNWQNSQWLRGGAKKGSTLEYLNLVRA